MKATPRLKRIDAAEAISPFKADEWKSLTPAQRLCRAWNLRSRLPDPDAVHDRKLFPKPQ
jgi:hypothetical protein